MLHHAATYGSDSCFLLVGGDKDLMGIHHVFINPGLIEAYEAICCQFARNDLRQFYQPGMNVPDPPKKWMDAFLTAKLRSLKMDKASFKYHLGLWRVLNIDIDAPDGVVRVQSDYVLPLPPTVRIVPLSIALWNALKGGGDTCTKLLDNCQERVGIRSECIMACARLLLYFAIIFHRANQWCNAKKDLEFYPSAAHARHANNVRAAFMDSLELLCQRFLGQAREAGKRSDGLHPKQDYDF